ncbi:MAG: carboxypeptidase-like regulatory domain-containing protein [Candidatus Micrarchaeota archaeon]
MYGEPAAGEKQDKGKLVLIAALVVVGAAAIWFLTQQGAGGEVKNVKIRVFAGTQPFSNASITLVDVENKTIASGALNDDGEITFASLPSAQYRVLISFDGRVRASQFVDLTKGRNSFSLRLPPGAAFKYYKGGFRIEALDFDTKAGIEGAKISYENGRDTGLLIAGTDGAAVIPVNYEDLVRVRAEADGYAEESAAFLASPEGASLYLKKASVAAREGGAAFAAPETTSVEVSVWTDDGGDASKGIVRAYECSTSALLSSAATAADGIARIYNVSADTSVYFNVEADGYVAWSGTCESIFEGLNPFDVHLNAKTADNSAEGTLRVADENGNLTSADVVILSPPRTVYRKFSCSGECLLDLPANSIFYASVSASGRVPAVSDFFVSGEDANVIVPMATAGNSAALTIIARDGNSGLPIEGALAAVYDSDGLYLDEAKKTGTDGRARFGPLLKGREYEADAVYYEALASEYVTLENDTEVALELDAFWGILNFTAVAADTGKPTGALFTVSQGEDESSCSSPCVLRANAFAEAKITAEANGYLDYSASETLKPREKKDHEASLIPKGSNISRSDTFVRFDGLFEANGSEAKKIYANGTYIGRLFLSPAEGSNESGIALRVGDEGNVSGFGISGYAPAPSSAEKSGWYEPTSAGVCTDLTPDRAKPQAGLYKWAELRFRGSGARTVTFTIRAGKNGTSEDELRLYYRAYSVKAGDFLRIPSDDELDDSENAETKAGCYAYSDSAIYAIERGKAAKPSPTPTPSPSPSPSPSPTPQFTKNGTVWLEGGKIKTDFLEIRMQADSILPGDAVPLNLSGTGDCEVQYAIRGADEKCFEYDGENALLIFKSNEMNPACGLHANGNSTKLDATMVFSTPCLSGTTDVPIIVDFAEAESTFAEPFSVTPGDSTAKLFYLISEMQAERRMRADYSELAKDANGTVNASSNATTAASGEISFDGAEAKAAAWPGPNKLTITENNATVREYNYAKLASYFPSVGTVGGGTVEDCDGFLCCSRGWCDATDFQKAFDDFKARAEEAAMRSAFRRADGEPLRTLTNKPFRYVMVAQLREGALAALEGNGITFENDNCSMDLPAIVEIAAISEGEEFNYTARVLQVDESFGASGEKLCGFLQADGTTVRATDHATLASITQAADNAPQQVTSSFQTGDALTKCKNADLAYRNAQRATQLAAEAMNNRCGSGKIPFSQAGSSLLGGMKECVLPTGAPAACGGVTAAADSLAATYIVFKNCIATATPLGICYLEMAPAIGAGVVTATTCVSGYHAECTAYCGTPPLLGCTKTATCEASCSPAAQICASAMGAFEASLLNLKRTADECDAAKGFAAESPGSMPQRSAWYSCYAYEVGCRIRCQEKPAYVEMAAFQNVLYYVTRFGLENNCVPREPSTLGADAGAASSAVAALAGSTAGCVLQAPQQAAQTAIDVGGAYQYYEMANTADRNALNLALTGINKIYTSPYIGFVGMVIPLISGPWNSLISAGKVQTGIGAGAAAGQVAGHVVGRGALGGVGEFMNGVRAATGYDTVSNIRGGISGLTSTGFTAATFALGECELKSEKTGAVYDAARGMTQALPAPAVGAPDIFDYAAKYAGASAAQSGFLGWLDAPQNPAAGGGSGATGIAEVPAKGAEDSAVYPDESEEQQAAAENAIIR